MLPTSSVCGSVELKHKIEALISITTNARWKEAREEYKMVDRVGSVVSWLFA